MEYRYKAISTSGETIHGKIEALSRNDAEMQVSELGYIPVEVTESTGVKTEFTWQRLNEMLNPVKTEDLVLYTKQFRTMLRAGVNIITILEILQHQTENPALKRVTLSIQQDLNEGETIYEAFEKHPTVFSPLYCSMVNAGEVSGSLPEVLERLIYIIEHEHRIKSDIKAALRYPAIVVTTLVAAFFILLTFVIPKFVSIFKKAGIDLPLPTKICLAMYTVINSYWILLLIAGVALFAGIVLFLKTDRGKLVKDTIVLSIPITGPLFVKAVMARFASIFSILLTSGVAILDSLDVLSKTIGNRAITRQFDTLSGKLSEGQGIAVPLKSARFFPPMVVNMIAIGEEAGSLDEMLKEVAKHYDDEVEYAVKGLSEAIGPILTIGLAVVVGFFALAIFLPMWDLTKMVK